MFPKHNISLDGQYYSSVAVPPLSVSSTSQAPIVTLTPLPVLASVTLKVCRLPATNVKAFAKL